MCLDCIQLICCIIFLPYVLTVLGKYVSRMYYLSYVLPCCLMIHFCEMYSGLRIVVLIVRQDETVFHSDGQGVVLPFKLESSYALTFFSEQ